MCRINPLLYSTKGRWSFIGSLWAKGSGVVLCVWCPLLPVHPMNWCGVAIQFVPITTPDNWIKPFKFKPHIQLQSNKPITNDLHTRTFLPNMRWQNVTRLLTCRFQKSKQLFVLCPKHFPWSIGGLFQTWLTPWQQYWGRKQGQPALHHRKKRHTRLITNTTWPIKDKHLFGFDQMTPFPSQIEDEHSNLPSYLSNTANTILHYHPVNHTH
jgi:hypothetical protein